MPDDLDRRAFVRATAAITGAGLVAGCSGSDGAGSDGTAATERSDGLDTVEAPSEVASYVGESSNFDGSVVVMTDRGSVTVAVGAEGNGGAFAFAPPAVQVSAGTTVVWEWTGNGGRHNVKSAGDGPIDSGPAVVEEGTTYEYTFEESGTYLYQCTPHVTLGMVGAVVVE